MASSSQTYHLPSLREILPCPKSILVVAEEKPAMRPSPSKSLPPSEGRRVGGWAPCSAQEEEEEEQVESCRCQRGRASRSAKALVTAPCDWNEWVGGWVDLRASSSINDDSSINHPPTHLSTYPKRFFGQLEFVRAGQNEVAAVGG